MAATLGVSYRAVYAAARNSGRAVIRLAGVRRQLRYLPTVSCGTLPTPHENFKNMIGGRVGRKISEAKPSNRMVSMRVLANGHRELEFAYLRTCRYFYEVAPDGTIVAWHFEGLETDCVIYL